MQRALPESKLPKVKKRNPNQIHFLTSQLNIVSKHRTYSVNYVYGYDKYESFTIYISFTQNLLC